MELKYFLCCLPLRWGVMLMGAIFAIVYFILGSSGLQMVLEGNYDEDLVWFFRKMSIKTCVSISAVIFYLLAIINILLAYGAFTDNHQMVGTWMLVHFTVFMLTLYSALVNTYLLFHAGELMLQLMLQLSIQLSNFAALTGYAMFVVKSFYSTLTPSFESDDEESSEEEV
ncbi:hypothetical protein KR038_007855 [Drosophila bunnanda]|nr:hypothetical protein KR038_007855 [Drosophila bunnanda]